MAELSYYNPVGSQTMSRELNQSEYHFDRNMSRPPENIVTIFTVNPRPQFSASAGMMFAGKGKNERYRKVASISDPKYYVDDLAIEGSKNQKKTTADDGKWVAMDWLNPDNVYNLDQDFVVPSLDYSTNLLVRGLFFIVRPYDPAHGNMDDKPTEEEIAAGEKRLLTRYTQLTQLYQTTDQSDPKMVSDVVKIDGMIDALNFAGIKTPHNTTLEAKSECQVCGETIKAGVKFHKSESLGVICIEPTVDGWKAAVAAGIKSREDAAEAGFTWPGRSPNAH